MIKRLVISHVFHLCGGQADCPHRNGDPCGYRYWTPDPAYNVGDPWKTVWACSSAKAKREADAQAEREVTP